MALVLDTAAVAGMARAMWPDLAEVADARFGAWQAWAERIAGTAFGDARSEAVALLVAHAVVRSAIGSGTSPGGFVTSIRTLSLSASFGAPTGPQLGSDADLMGSRPGAAYLTLRAAIPGINLPRVIGGVGDPALGIRRGTVVGGGGGW